MADFASYTHKWRATTATQGADANKISKRNRQPVSCQQCRSRKLKCDRGHPCDGCFKRGDADTCAYGKMPTTTTSSEPTRKDDARPSNMKAQDRLKHLEDLVRNMVETPSRTTDHDSNATTTSVSSNDVHQGADNVMLHQASGNGGSYTGSTHWSAILQHIHELKNDVIADSGRITVEPPDISTPNILFGGQRPASLEQILQTHLPPRIQIDRRIFQYFNARYMVIPFIHNKQFERQYEEFWKDPLSTDIMWISVMFSMCCLAASLSIAAGQTPDASDATHSRDSFETAAGQCLVLGNYAKPQRYVVEALGLHLQCKYASSLDPQREVALLFAVQTRLAYLMGYHRDGTNFPKQFTPFEIEMRRRIWAMLKQFDMLVAFSLGIPNNVPPQSWDTRNPSNLWDTDFDEDTKELPPPRPETEITQTMYFVVKARIIDVYSKICHHAISFPTSQPTFSDIMSLDAQMRQQVDTIPETLRIRPVSQSVTNPGYEVIIRLNISCMWRKALCVLHRKYMTCFGTDYSYNTCVEAASAICASIVDIYPEFQPGGTFEKDYWMLTSFTIVDFLLGIVVLCLAMSISRKRHVCSGGELRKWLDLGETKAVLDLLDKSQAICLELSTRSREAHRVQGIVSAILVKLRTDKSPMYATTKNDRFLNESFDGTQSERDGPTSLSQAASNQNGVSLQPLSLAEDPPQPNVSASVPLANWHGPSTILGTSPAIGQVSLSLSQMTSPPATFQSESILFEQPDTSQDQASAGRFMSNAAAPNDFSMDLDLGPFANFMNGPEGAGTIDWTQLDQFTGLFGLDSGMNVFDPSQAEFSNIQHESLARLDEADYSSWNSTPPYNLGGRTRDPVTGQSQRP